jgi:hypothetical protein
MGLRRVTAGLEPATAAVLPNKPLEGESTHMLEFVPNAGQLSQVMAQAAAPAFVLGAVAGFVSILQG